MRVATPTQIIHEMGIIRSRLALDQRKTWVGEVDVVAARSFQFIANTQSPRRTVDSIVLHPWPWL